ncbi:MAG: octaprenyl diphosphate synthase [Pseudomonadales bacterium]|nr:octaprenyl diphosphate synthase [Pseudomonadales bacterium]
MRPVYELVAPDFRAVNQLIPKQLTSDVNLVSEIGSHIVASGGKRLRPLMVLLTSGALGYNGEQHVKLAAIIEFLHTATLLHDDVVDHSGLRRGKVTANEKWGNAPSVLVGDFLYSRAFQMMVDVGQLDIMAILADATNTIAEGEVLQLANIGNIATTEAEYREIIRCKTALLFEAACHTGAVLARDKSHPSAELMRKFGLHFGITYQLVDDWLDYVGDSETLGKNVGDDLTEGKLTLPLIYAIQNAPRQQRQTIEAAIARRSIDELPEVLDIVRTSGALDYVYQAVRNEADQTLCCLESLPKNAYVDALKALTEYSTSRLF